ncbi:hypothetical protein [Novosphingobium sp. Chol11]|uniref:hypothetical protein n=1 Tax=Novosphingobium sp. Chol11 TaxID=1385763 RepID=UPI0025CEA37E|nr:hypothetical protein [Novosphingobium sp. Chol11]
MTNRIDTLTFTAVQAGMQPSAMSFDVAQLRVTRDLHKAEAALDEALLSQAQLLMTMVGARRDGGFEPFVGQDALMRLLKSQQSMVDAGGELARVHGRLRTIATETNGGVDGCPVRAEIEAEVTTPIANAA